MKRVKLIWLAGLAAFALSAVAVSAPSASAAEPEWGHCVPVKSKGHFEDSNCTKEDFKENKAHEKKYKGKFEWDSGAAAVCFGAKKGHYEDSSCTKEDFKEDAKTHEKKYKGKYELTGGAKFTGEGGAGVLKAHVFECAQEKKEAETGQHRAYPRGECEVYGNAGASEVECSGEHASGEASSSKEVVNVSVRFTGCTAFGAPATSEGLPAGEIQVNPLKGRLGYINKASHEVGVVLEPAAAKSLFVTFFVLEGGVEVNVGAGNPTEGAFFEEEGTPGLPGGGDAVISPITPVDQMTHTFTQQYRIESTKVPCPPANCNLTTSKEGLDVYQNVPVSLEGGTRATLETRLNAVFLEPPSLAEWGSSGEEITNTNTVEGTAEIKG